MFLTTVHDLFQPDAGPGDANSDYIKLKVVGNVSNIFQFV